jgi:hypothetical protein
MKIYITNTGSVNPLIAPTCISEKENGVRLYCREPDYKTYITDSGMRRRMSRAVKMGVHAGCECLSGTTVKPDAIITATGLGCMGDTEKFLKTSIDTHEQLLNPTPFIQSTFNTVGAQIAMLTGNTNYNMTYVHRGFSFEHALSDAIMKFRNNEADNILVGSYEETTDTSFKIGDRLNFWKKQPTEETGFYDKPGNGSISGEGSWFFLLSNQIQSNCALTDLSTVYGTNPETVHDRFRQFLHRNDITPDDIDIFISGENGDSRDQSFYDMIENELNNSTIIRYKFQFGEYPTVSAASVWLGYRLIESGNIPTGLIKKDRGSEIRKILLYNHYKGKNHSFILMEKSNN